jgi:hypothetical protein
MNDSCRLTIGHADFSAEFLTPLAGADGNNEKLEGAQ